jgi:hypothetical protein
MNDNDEGNSPGCDVEAVVAKMDSWAKQRTIVRLIHPFCGEQEVFYRGWLTKLPDDSYAFAPDFETGVRPQSILLRLTPRTSPDASIEEEMVLFDGISILEDTSHQQPYICDACYAERLKSGKTDC